MANGSNQGLYVPTTNVWDVSILGDIEGVTPQLKELLIRLYQNLNRISLALNQKESGTYYPIEFVDGNLWFPNPASDLKGTSRSEKRMVVNFGALPNTGTKSVAHGITCTTSTSCTRIYGAASKPTVAFSYLPIPFASPTAAENIKLDIDATNVNITTGSDRTAYTTCYVVVEYLQS